MGNSLDLGFNNTVLKTSDEDKNNLENESSENAESNTESLDTKMTSLNVDETSSTPQKSSFEIVSEIKTLTISEECQDSEQSSPEPIKDETDQEIENSTELVDNVQFVKVESDFELPTATEPNLLFEKIENKVIENDGNSSTEEPSEKTSFDTEVKSFTEESTTEQILSDESSTESADEEQISVESKTETLTSTERSGIEADEKTDILTTDPTAENTVSIKSNTEIFLTTETPTSEADPLTEGSNVGDQISDEDLSSTKNSNLYAENYIPVKSNPESLLLTTMENVVENLQLSTQDPIQVDENINSEIQLTETLQSSEDSSTKNINSNSDLDQENFFEIATLEPLIQEYIIQKNCDDHPYSLDSVETIQTVQESREEAVNSQTFLPEIQLKTEEILESTSEQEISGDESDSDQIKVTEVHPANQLDSNHKEDSEDELVNNNLENSLGLIENDRTLNQEEVKRVTKTTSTPSPLKGFSYSFGQPFGHFFYNFPGTGVPNGSTSYPKFRIQPVWPPGSFVSVSSQESKSPYIYSHHIFGR